jgi:hypothetical protein
MATKPPCKKSHLLAANVSSESLAWERLSARVRYCADNMGVLSRCISRPPTERIARSVRDGIAGSRDFDPLKAGMDQNAMNAASISGPRCLSDPAVIALTKASSSGRSPDKPGKSRSMPGSCAVD